MAETEVLPTDHARALKRAISVLDRGGVIAVPTDTIYGIAADAWNGVAVKKLYHIKSRSELKSIPVLVAGVEAIVDVAQEPMEQVWSLARSFWPGPLTMVLGRKPELPSAISASETVGVRAPDHEFSLALLRRFGPLATTSANLSGESNPLSANQVIAALSEKIDLILDGGVSTGTIPSTVVDCTVNPPELLRQGPISLESVLRIWESH